MDMETETDMEAEADMEMECKLTICGHGYAYRHGHGIGELLLSILCGATAPYGLPLTYHGAVSNGTICLKRLFFMKKIT